MRRRPALGALLGMVVLGAWILLALIGPLIAPHDPTHQDLVARLTPPAWSAGGSPAYPLGTDELGRDILSRLIVGARIALIVGATVVALSATTGTIIGLLAGYYRGWVDTIAMGAVDVLLAFPFLLLALALLAVVGASLLNIILVLGLTGWVPFARTVRADTLSVREREFVEAAHASGTSNFGIVRRHILPNVMGPVIVLATLQVATAVLAEAALTFLGLGIPPSTPTWGQMLAAGRQYIFDAWWLSTLPGLCLFVVVLAVNVVGDWARDVWDPRLR